MTLTSFTRRFAAPHWRWYAGGFVLLAAVNLVTLGIPQLAKEAINALVSLSEAEKTGAGKEAAEQLLGHSSSTALAIIGLGFLLIIIRSLSRIIIFWPGRKIETDSKSHLFARMLRVPQSFYLQHGMGDLISRLSSDVGQLRAFFAFGVLQLLNVTFLLVFTIAKMASVHPRLTAYALLPLLAAILLTRLAWPRMQHWSRENQAAQGRLTSVVTEAFVNVHVIQANAAEATFKQRAERDNEMVYTSNMQLVYVRMLIFPLMTCLAGLSQLVVLFYGSNEVIAGRLSVGDILAFNVYIGLLTFPLSAMGIILALYQRARTAIERIAAIDAAQPEGPAPGAKPVAAAPPESDRDAKSLVPLLEIKNLSFRYAEADAPLRLDGLSLTLAPGRRIGLFGKVGSGKSTLFGIITRLLDPPRGTVFFRGQDVLDVPPAELRAEIGYALQQVHLFSDTIRANLAFGLVPIPPQIQLDAAARGAQILGEIEGFPAGFETQIGEKGVRLSGGQRQRLALARLFVRNQPLLLLDDVLSAVDHETERRLVQYIDSLGCAMLIASHRGSALRACDEILVLDDGNVVDRGSFKDLTVRWPELARDS